MNFIAELIDGGDNSHRNQLRSPYDWRFGGGSNHFWAYDSYSGSHSEGVDDFFDYCEYKESYGHPYQILGRTNRNIGGKFVHTKISLDNPPKLYNLYRGGSTWRESTRHLWSSGSLANIFLGTKPVSYETALAKSIQGSGLGLVSDNDLDAFGTTAIARVSPTNPLVDLSTSLAELLREGLPQVPGTAGNVGGEYLNVMFGYLPLHGDVTSLRKVAADADKLLRQYEQDSGKWVRRKYDPPEVVSTTKAVQGNASVSGAGSGLSTIGTRLTTTTTRTKTWFEGAFTYYLPRKGWRRTVAELDYLYGIRPGVDTLWQLTGYSWLADYFANIGDVFTNVNAFTADGLVLPYGYVMCKQHVTVDESWFGDLYIGGIRSPREVNTTVSYTTHQRRLATPFGFGLSDSGLSARQQSILVALGISRL